MRKEIKASLMYDLFRALYNRDSIMDKDRFIGNFMETLDRLDFPDEPLVIQLPNAEENGQIDLL